MTEKQLKAARDALGNEDAPADEIEDAISQHEGESVEDMEIALRTAEAEFDKRGGRGVDLADEIDGLRMALAVAKL